MDAEPGPTSHSPLPPSCTLGPDDGRSRTLRWQRLHEAAGPVARLDAGRLEVRYQPGPGVRAEPADLAAAEQLCCSFVTWSVSELEGQPVLHVVSPTGAPEAVESIAALFGVRKVAVGVQATYDAVARAYDAQLGDELAGKPLDRALLAGFLELAGEGSIADVGCGPGHVTRHLAARHADVVGIDLSPGMIAVARERAPELTFVEGSLLQLPVEDGAWAGAVALYSVIHLTPQERVTALRELARALRPGGWLLLSFHVESAECAPGAVSHLSSWFGESVDIEAYFLDPAEVAAEMARAGLAVMATTDRQPSPGLEYPSRRCYLLAQRR